MTITQRRTEAADSELLVAGELGTIHHSCLPDSKAVQGPRKLHRARGFSRAPFGGCGHGEAGSEKPRSILMFLPWRNMFGFLWLVLS